MEYETIGNNHRMLLNFSVRHSSFKVIHSLFGMFIGFQSICKRMTIKKHQLYASSERS